uniref:LysM domain-containing protein n=2 Tax=Pyramimonas obovata TaxID=1411642 RepID=A0A7S0RRU6_9CHLO|mmetsp:Transcript_39960/g.86949  ORF Transcript_39960/g.86949 Transcript_39960/m.86949 type:complete len:295 (+) Transcript_39960:99-983(+)|eukprot:CAMPEP_0118920880 /NCGR_PEP_ID=MMETSP1169-20130426/307_1 /TAXON_ID=36882 /ORGANISM="Pyramimonas obovata, Strain CCMP722" /LENGTH=294 /DNA_ID=CAMNT_0006861499 /DNA_START=82 /DNA_END=966 /DNA_ORIENTATION=-
MSDQLLQISIIEGRNLDIDASNGDPYVELHLAGPGLKGDDTLKQAPPVKGIPTHAGLMYKWLKDYKLAIPDKNKTTLTAVVKQKGRDAVIGAVQIDISKIEGSTQVRWHKIEDGAKQAKGEICLVLRYVTKKDAVRSERAASPRSTRVGERTTSPRREQAARAGTASPRRDARTTRTSVERIRSPGRTRRSSGGGGKEGTPKAAASEPRGKAKAPPREGKRGIFEKKGMVMGLGAAIAGLAAMALLRPQFYEVQEGDTICAVGICFNRNFKEVLDKNPNIIDPDKIYPGQKLRL